MLKSDFCGVAAILKPPGISSGDAAICCRNALGRALGGKVKCGHMGTLDPYAAGVLVLGFGKCTRLFGYPARQTKRYFARIRFGAETDTLDSAGKIVRRAPLPVYADAEAALKAQVGELWQVPPIYSAVNVNGRRAYDLARKGQEATLSARKVRIVSLDVVRADCESDGRCRSVDVDIVCESGVYIRSVCRDAALACGSAGYLAVLIRTECGGFRAEEAATLGEFCENPTAYSMSAAAYVARRFPVADATGTTAKKLANGIKMRPPENEFTYRPLGAAQAEPLPFELLEGEFALTLDGRLYALARATERGVETLCNLSEEKE